MTWNQLSLLCLLMFVGSKASINHQIFPHGVSANMTSNQTVVKRHFSGVATQNNGMDIPWLFTSLRELSINMMGKEFAVILLQSSQRFLHQAIQFGHQEPHHQLSPGRPVGPVCMSFQLGTAGTNGTAGWSVRAIGRGDLSGTDFSGTTAHAGDVWKDAAANTTKWLGWTYFEVLNLCATKSDNMIHVQRKTNLLIIPKQMCFLSSGGWCDWP